MPLTTIEGSKHTTGEVVRLFQVDGEGGWEDGGAPNSEALVGSKLDNNVCKGDSEAWREEYPCGLQAWRWKMFGRSKMRFVRCLQGKRR
jgi:hypothetical protein